MFSWILIRGFAKLKLLSRVMASLTRSEGCYCLFIASYVSANFLQLMSTKALAIFVSYKNQKRTAKLHAHTLPAALVNFDLIGDPPLFWQEMQ